MNSMIKSAALGFMLVGLVACGKQDEGKGKQEAAPVALEVPTSTSDQDWKLYLSGVVKQHMKGVRSSPYMYYLPSATVEDFEDQYVRQLDNVVGVVMRTVTPGNMLAFGSPESSRMADMVIESFKEAQAGSFKGVKVLLVGKREDEQRVREALAPSEAEFIFVPID
ncbi:hypothetical protein [Pseudomarimonas arenosa]|uniref:Uncharacterized protein n=1 Tax=Pseudomarimonas arenosa TaxID=2774145 RepID=A0AAW3ZIW5_9GAMM|nr:hypothetical protein [Pseudomarimonas arenosa]MBD8525931.1 hypothetical protein [Pseudomarimonas arenosa]